MTPALTHFGDPPGDVSQLQKVGLHPLDSLSGKHSKGISSLLPPPPELLTHFVASECHRIFAWLFHEEEGDNGVRHLSTLVCVHGCRRQSFFFT